MRSTPIIVWTNQALPATGTVTSNPIPLDQVFGYACQVVWAGTPTGAFTIQCSCDKGYTEPNGTVTGVTNWDAVPTATSISASGSTGSDLQNFPDVGYRWVQIVYTASSGTGTASATISTKGI